MSLPTHARYVVVGAGMHGLSTAWHLARKLAATGKGDGGDIVVLDKTKVGAGASGIACGVIRNNYFQPAMRELMAHSVDVWDSDPEAFHYHPVGYLQIAPEMMHEDVASIYMSQQAIGYASTFVEGEHDCRLYLENIFSDWQGQGITNILHERRGGYANNLPSVRALADKAAAAGVLIHTGTQVRGLQVDGGAVTAVETDQGTINCDQLVVAVGPWIRDLWTMLGLPETIPVRVNDNLAQLPMWTYWSLQEGTVSVEPEFLYDNRGEMPPVFHVDSDQPLLDDTDGSLVCEPGWGIYFKPDFNFGGVQGGAVPQVVGRPAYDVAIDPYGPASPDFVVGEKFARMWTSALAHCLKRFKGKGHLFSGEPSGVIGAFTPDSFPVFDVFLDNAYVIADSNHGYKMIGVGALVADELLGTPSTLLEPFRFDRYAGGRLHPISHSPFPWS